MVCSALDPLGEKWRLRRYCDAGVPLQPLRQNNRRLFSGALRHLGGWVSARGCASSFVSLQAATSTRIPLGKVLEEEAALVQGDTGQVL